MGILRGICMMSCLVLWCAVSGMSRQGNILKGTIEDAITKEPLGFATVQLKFQNGISYATVADYNGLYSFSKLPSGSYRVEVSYLGYDKEVRTLFLSKDAELRFRLKTTVHSLNEVVVTASEQKGFTSSSRIDRTAMEHLQPSCFTDLLELLPGGKSADPNMGSANAIRLREAGSASEDIASLGVAFVMDGMPLNEDANLQYVPGTYQGGKEFVSKGVDMRTISTDNIESVEIVRGIPSVEYGDLTGGLVNIKRKWSASPFTARFKADSGSKLFSVGKGWAIGGKHILNVDLGYLDSKMDPRDSRENYRRFSVSLRWATDYKTPFGQVDWNAHADYTGSFDNVKVDKDVTVKENSYKSSYDKFAVGASWSLKRAESVFRRLVANVSVSREYDKIKERCSVSIDRPTAIPNSLTEGEADGTYLPYTYVADMLVDGKPLYANAKLVGDFVFRTWDLSHTLRGGGEWNFSKNDGDGSVYDMDRPLNVASVYRPRRYKDIPGRWNLSLFVEEQLRMPLGKHELALSAGLRANALLGLADTYALSGKFYLDPRVNVQWKWPAFGANDDWLVDWTAGIGWLSKFPTTAQLYPDYKYVDIVQLNYYHNRPDYRRVNLMTYKWDNANYDLRPSRNRKWELRLGVSYRGNNMSVTYFQERMNNAFRDISYYRILSYKNYDVSGVNPSELTSRPSLESLPYTDKSIINTYSKVGNGTRVRKQGVEFTFSSKRVDWLKTRFTVTGAYFKTVYSNSMPEYKSSSVLIQNEQLKYVGLYDWEEGTMRESFNTNFMSDTYLPKIGMAFSLSAQCVWFTASRPLWNNGTPVSYVDNQGNVYPFTEESASNAELRHLVQTYSSSYFDKTRVPFAMDINLKATKEVGKFLKVSLFVNRILTAYPSYYRGSTLIRRSSSPYFGMEANLRF